ncbi:PTS sugar transporter subunit IIA [Tetragenococcus halophilus]|uniref:PTS sugar transporter subunit IIA n=1 Tax=Tetragenococcus halophilus TaxID=51669 RepID=UPI001F27C3A2|nr:PTS sugar transporter subunit IIA [Tetragenococcus halophilus]MDN6146498.1 PTS sugar transporter subunit IIA [Tetragenococcus koreensis]MDN6569995.1 PTS sugar transporter subunit IIA [Staphylococcus equorum]MCF1602544.1 PTS sugar transporter subunit IIA [Tetragenococcus halophilus]MDN6166404.1 PTS sugar transporter subunit IIA [Tetragenococcus koreensis]MDN6267421.1 PTS sugar transporter subunit IIA [Tetragenococcus koreensis]
MGKIIDENTIFLNKEFVSKEEALKDIAETAIALQIVDSYAEILQALLQREEMVPTAVGKGVAIPHCKSEVVKDSKVFLYRLSNEIKWDEEEKVTLIFAIITNDQNSDHLSILAKLSRNLLKESFLTKIKNASSTKEVYELINNILVEV